MSHHYSINTLLKIQDPNISFSDIPWEEKKIHGYNALIFHAILTYSIEKSLSVEKNILSGMVRNFLRLKY